MAEPEKAVLENNCELKLRLYKLLLQKYSEIINEKEKRTIGEIKSLINGEDLTIQSILEGFKKEDYSFETGYPAAAEKAFRFVSREIDFVELDLSLNYWIEPKEIMTSKVGDDEDIALFLASILLGLGDEKAEVVIAELDNLKTHAFVITEIGEKFYILDPSQKHEFAEFSGKKEEVLLKYDFNNAKIKRFLYRFNSKNYEQFIE